MVAPTSLPPCCSVTQVPPVAPCASMRVSSCRYLASHVLAGVIAEHIGDGPGEGDRAVRG